MTTHAKDLPVCIFPMKLNRQISVSFWECERQSNTSQQHISRCCPITYQQSLSPCPEVVGLAQSVEDT